MSAANNNATIIDGVDRIDSSREAMMAAFDRLPAPLRHLCNYAPLRLAPDNMVGVPVPIVDRSCRQLCDKQAPGWKPLRGDWW